MVTKDPFPSSSPQSDAHSAYNKIRRYFRRIFKFEQMDFQFALWQIYYLLVAPGKLTRVFRTRRNFKSQYARDDPAFLILFAGALCITSIGFALALNYSFMQFLKFLIIEIFIDCIAIGVIIATTLWYLTNKFLKPSSIPVDVEWGFAFDIHLNAFFPPLILLHVVVLNYYKFFIEGQYNEFSIVNKFVIGPCLGNLFWLIAALYYDIITFTGYHSVRILKNTNLFLIPIPISVMLYFLLMYLKFDISRAVFEMYRNRMV